MTDSIHDFLDITFDFSQGNYKDEFDASDIRDEDGEIEK